MPQHIEYWLCNLCERHHNTLKAAEECEKRGIVLPKFMNKEVVEVLDAKLGIVHWVMMDNLVHCVHKPIFEYEIRVAIDVSQFSGIQTKVFQENDIKKSIRSGTDCPLCGSKNLTQLGGIDERPFIGSSFGQFIHLDVFRFRDQSPGNMSPFVCLRCHEEFYSREQREKMERCIRAGLRVSLATS